jgi:CRISPR-associated protein Cmr5
MRNLQKLIPLAIEAIETTKIVEHDGGNKYIDGEFNGYISSFGGSIISSGLLPSIIFYSQKKGAKADRPKIIAAVEFILQKDGYGPNFKLLDKVKVLYTGTLNFIEINRLSQKVEEALIALKLAIRIFAEKPKDPKTR